MKVYGLSINKIRNRLRLFLCVMKVYGLSINKIRDLLDLFVVSVCDESFVVCPLGSFTRNLARLV